MKNHKYTVFLNMFKVIFSLLCICCVFFSVSNVHASIDNSVEISNINIDSNENNNSASATDIICADYNIDGLSFTRMVPASSTVVNDPYSFDYVLENIGSTTIEEFYIKIDFYKELTGEITGSNVSALIDQNHIPATIISGGGNATVLDDLYSKTLRIHGLNLANQETITITLSGTSDNSDLESEEVASAVRTISVDAYADFPLASPDPNCTTQDAYNTDSNTSSPLVHITSTDLYVIKTSSGGADSSTNTTGQLIAGGDVIYTISINNIGSGTAVGSIKITDTMPARVTPTDQGGGNYTSSPNWTCTYIAPTLTCTNPNSIASGGASSLVIEGVVSQT